MAAERPEAASPVLSGQQPLQRYLQEIAEYNRVFQNWEKRVKRIIERYISEIPDNGSEAYRNVHYAILWANVQTLKAATFAKLPQPDVSRRFGDTDPVGRVAALILQRCLTYEIEEYPDYASTMNGSVLDRFLGGRGTAWARYEPHMRAAAQQLPVDGAEVTEDIDKPGEELDYECAPTDYVHWRDFGHAVARTWEEVTCVWRRVWMTEDALKQRFAEWYRENPAKTIPLEARKQDDRQMTSTEDTTEVACIYERWDKTKKSACWFNKTAGILDERDDPLGLTDFFPCPRPLYATLTNETLIPTPDFTLYQDQAKALDLICARQTTLIQALRVAGVYDAANTQIQRIFTETDDTTLVPVENWVSFAEKNGLKGAFELVDLAPLSKALSETYAAAAEIQNQIYDITGISDIVRGQSVASETATAQQIKGQYASLRLKAMQDDVARFATDLLKLKAQVICGKFAPETILAISASDQLRPEDQQVIPQAMQLLLGERAINPEADSPNPVRSFRIEVAADTLIYLNEQQEKQDRMEFMTAAASFLKTGMEAAAAAPQLTHLVGELMKFGIGAFPQARQIEGVFDSTIDQLEEAQKQPPPPDPAAQAEQAKMQAEQQRAQFDAQLETQKLQGEAALEQQRMAMEDQHAKQQMAMDSQVEALKQQMEAQKAQAEQDFQRWKAQLDAETKIVVAQIGANSKAATAMGDTQPEDGAGAEPTTADAVTLAIDGLTQALAPLMEELQRPVKVVRGPDGRMVGLQ